MQYGEYLKIVVRNSQTKHSHSLYVHVHWGRVNWLQGMSVLKGDLRLKTREKILSKWSIC